MVNYNGSFWHGPSCPAPAIAPSLAAGQGFPGLKVLSGIGASFGEEDVITTRVTAHQRLQVVDLRLV